MTYFLCLERAHGCLGAWEGGPVVPGPPPLGPWGASLGGVPGPNYHCNLWAVALGFRIKIDVDLSVVF